MLNMKFAEMMELTEDELMEVKGGEYTLNLIPAGASGWGVRGIYPGWGWSGMSPHKSPFSWTDGFSGFINERRQP